MNNNNFKEVLGNITKKYYQMDKNEFKKKIKEHRNGEITKILKETEYFENKTDS